MQSGWSVGLVMVVMGGLCARGFGVSQPPTTVGYVIAGVLVGAGLLLFLRRPVAWWVGLGAAVLTLVTGLAAQAGRPQWALPVPPFLSLVVGLYLILRLTIARSYFRRRAQPDESQ